MDDIHAKTILHWVCLGVPLIYKKKSFIGSNFKTENLKRAYLYTTLDLNSALSVNKSIKIYIHYNFPTKRTPFENRCSLAKNFRTEGQQISTALPQCSVHCTPYSSCSSVWFWANIVWLKYMSVQLSVNFLVNNFLLSYCVIYAYFELYPFLHKYVRIGPSEMHDFSLHDLYTFYLTP